MSVRRADAQIVAWARQHRYTCYYADETGLPADCLKVHLGQVTACFQEGRLVRMSLQVDGELIGEAYEQLRGLLTTCSEAGAYMAQQPARSLSTESRFCFLRN